MNVYHIQSPEQFSSWAIFTSKGLKSDQGRKAQTLAKLGLCILCEAPYSFLSDAPLATTAIDNLTVES